MEFTTEVSNWKELLLKEGIPLNSAVEFYCHNQGIRGVIHNNKKINLSKPSRKFAIDWILENRVESFIQNPLRLDGYDWKKPVLVKISFCHGETTGHPAYGNKREQKNWYKHLEEWRSLK